MTLNSIVSVVAPADPRAAPSPPSPAAARSYAELLADSEERRRAADDILLRRMIAIRDTQSPPDAGVPGLLATGG